MTVLTNTSQGSQRPANGNGRGRVFAPVTDIYEDADAITILAEMPGTAPDGLDVTFERGVLAIRGRGGAGEHPGYRRVRTEYAEGDFERVFTVSDDIDHDRIEATLKNGLLTLVLPKAGPAKPRRIEVKSF